MAGNRSIARGRWLPAVLGTVLFLLAFLPVFLYALPGDVVLSLLRSSLEKKGWQISGDEARMAFPLAVHVKNVSVGPRGGEPIYFDSVNAGWEWTGLFRWLPGHLTLTHGTAVVDVRTSPGIWNPSSGRIRLAGIGSEHLAAVLPARNEFGFLAEDAEIRWETPSRGTVTGTGSASLGWLRIPVPSPGSPVREAVLRDVRLRFGIRNGDIHVSSLAASYEGSAVDGTGVITQCLAPARSTITFHLRIQNPAEGKVAGMFNMLAKNAKNANLNIKGTLLAPTGEFQFF